MEIHFTSEHSINDELSIKDCCFHYYPNQKNELLSKKNKMNSSNISNIEKKRIKFIIYKINKNRNLIIFNKNRNIINIFIMKKSYHALVIQVHFEELYFIQTSIG